MKTNIFFIAAIFAAYFMSTACKKSGADLSEHYVLSYEFQDKVYDGADGDWRLIKEGKNITGIIIYRADLFGGQVNFTAPGCAYLSTNSNKSISQGANCTITYDDGTPIDSSIVYFYQSGSFTSTTSNCIHQAGNGYLGYYSYDLCDIDVHFSVTLVNNKGDKIEIKNGSVKGTFAF